MNLTMLAMLDRADRFSGLPGGTAKPLRFLAGFQEAEPYLGLPARAFRLVAWLVKQTQAHDWEEGSRPIAWPSARRQAELHKSLRLIGILNMSCVLCENTL
jgi:replication initiation protein RepC